MQDNQRAFYAAVRENVLGILVSEHVGLRGMIASALLVVLCEQVLDPSVLGTGLCQVAVTSAASVNKEQFRSRTLFRRHDPQASV